MTKYVSMQGERLQETALLELYEDYDGEPPDAQKREQIDSELAEASTGVSETLRRVMSVVTLEFYAGLEHLLEGPEFVDELNDLAAFHPVDRAPYTQYLPGMPRIQEGDRGQERAEAIVRESFDDVASDEGGGLKATHFISRRDLAKYMLSAIRGGHMLLDDEHWSLWQKTHELQHSRDYCALGGAAVNLIRAVHRGTPLAAIEQHVINVHLTNRKTTYLGMQAGNASSYLLKGLQLPVSTGPEDNPARELWLRSAGALVVRIQQSTGFKEAVKAKLEADPEAAKIAKEKMQRAFDTPFSLDGAVVNNLIEAIAAAIPGVTSELQRPREDDISESSWERSQAEIIVTKLTSGFTALSGLGIGGPLTIQGVGLQEPPTYRKDNWGGKQEYPGSYRRLIDRRAAAILQAGQAFWRHEYHYPELKRAKDEGRTPIRTGDRCPFVFPDKLLKASPNLIEATAQMIYLISTKLDPARKLNKYDVSQGRPFRPSAAPDMREFLVRNDRSSRGLTYRKLGLLAARNYLERHNTRS